MKAKLKAAAVLIVTLLIGIILGIFGRGAFVEEKIKTDEIGNTADFIRLRLDHVIQPDASQKQDVERSLNRWTDSLKSLLQARRRLMTTILDSLQHDLFPLLTEEQRQRLNDELLFTKRRMQALSEASGAPGLIRIPFVVNRLQKSLDLNENQTEQLRSILNETQKALANDKTNNQSIQRFLLDTIAHKFEPILNEDQKQRFRQIREHMRSRPDE